MAAGREWWKLRASDVAPWISRLPVSIRTDKYNRLGWPGRPWDGHSDLPVGEWPWDGESDINEAEPLVDPIEAWDAAVVSGHEMKMLVTELRRLTGGMPELGVALPDHRDVCATLVGEEGDVVNTLFYGDNCNMAYGDAQAVLIKMIEGVRGLGCE